MKNRNKSKKIVSIYIPTYNEECNIGFLLKSLLKQKAHSYSTENIVVVNDGSTDKTKETVLELSQKYPTIKFLDDGKRIGKIDRLNQIYKINKSEILILFDGDLMLRSPYVIERMVTKFGKGVALVSPNKHPLKARTFVEKLINCLYGFFYEIRKDFNGGDTIHNFITCAYGISDEFAKKLYYPKNVYPITKFTYLAAVKNGLKFKFAKDTCVYFRSPGNIRDYSLQINRFSNVEAINERYYGSWVHNILYIPISRKLTVAVKMLLTHPLVFSLAILLRTILMLEKKKSSGRMWKLAISSKKLV